jgi:hypothetical protein
MLLVGYGAVPLFFFRVMVLSLLKIESMIEFWIRTTKRWSHNTLDGIIFLCDDLYFLLKTRKFINKKKIKSCFLKESIYRRSIYYSHKKICQIQRCERWHFLFLINTCQDFGSHFMDDRERIRIHEHWVPIFSISVFYLLGKREKKI